MPIVTHTPRAIAMLFRVAVLHHKNIHYCWLVVRQTRWAEIFSVYFMFCLNKIPKCVCHISIQTNIICSSRKLGHTSHRQQRRTKTRTARLVHTSSSPEGGEFIHNLKTPRNTVSLSLSLSLVLPCVDNSRWSKKSRSPPFTSDPS